MSHEPVQDFPVQGGGAVTGTVCVVLQDLQTQVASSRDSCFALCVYVRVRVCVCVCARA